MMCLWTIWTTLTCTHFISWGTYIFLSLVEMLSAAMISLLDFFKLQCLLLSLSFFLPHLTKETRSTTLRKSSIWTLPASSNLFLYPCKLKASLIALIRSRLTSVGEEDNIPPGEYKLPSYPTFNDAKFQQRIQAVTLWSSNGKAPYPPSVHIV